MRTRSHFFSLPPLIGDELTEFHGAFAPHREEFDSRETVGALGAWPKDLTGTLFWLSASPLTASVADPDLVVSSAFLTSVGIAKGRVVRQRGAFVVTRAMSEILGVAPLRDRIDLASRGAKDQLFIAGQRIMVGGADGLPYQVGTHLGTLGVATFDGALQRSSSERWLSDPKHQSTYLVAHDDHRTSEVIRYDHRSGQLIAQRLDARVTRPIHLALTRDRLAVFGPSFVQVFDATLDAPRDVVIPAGDLAMEYIVDSRETEEGLEVIFARRRKHGLRIAKLVVTESTIELSKISNGEFATTASSLSQAPGLARRILGVEVDHGDAHGHLLSLDVDLGSVERRPLGHDRLAAPPVMLAGARSGAPCALVATNSRDGSHPELLLLEAKHIDGPELATLQLAKHLPLDGQGLFVPRTQLA